MLLEQHRGHGRMSQFNIKETSQDSSPHQGANLTDQEEVDFHIPEPAHEAGRARRA